MKANHLLVTSIALLLLTHVGRSQDTAASVNITSASTEDKTYGIMGIHNPVSNWDTTLGATDVVDRLEDFTQNGYFRWPGGTNGNAMDWKTGAVDVELSGQTSYEPSRYYEQVVDATCMQTLGYARLSDYRALLQQGGVKGIITVNVFAQDPDDAGDLAKYCADNFIPVVGFELGNEISYYTADSGNQSKFETCTDYLNRVEAFNNAIKANYPNAKVYTSMSNDMNSTFDSDYKTYSSPYWDGVTFHLFYGYGTNATEAMESANSALDSLIDNINNYYVANLPNPNTKIYIGEMNVSLENGNVLANTQYHAIYQAESALRLAYQPNVNHIQGDKFYNSIYTPANDLEYVLEDAYQKGETVDPNSLDFAAYYRPAALAAKILAASANRAGTLWATAVTGGATVLKSDGTSMPALYAQAFEGDDAVNYLIVTNKSSQTHDLTVQMDNTNVAATFATTYTTSTDPMANNDTTTTVSIQTGSSSNPVVVPPYSVMCIQWNDTRAPLAPKAPSLVYAIPSSGQVVLDWMLEPNASSYEVEYGTTSGTYTTTVSLGNVNTYTVTGLTNGNTYYFVVRALNSVKISTVSNEAAVTLSAPSTPSITKAHPERPTRAIVEWQSVPGASGYKVEFGTSSGVYTSVIDVGNNVGQIVDGLTDGTEYYFAVYAYNAFGNSAASSELTVTPVNPLPLAPFNVTITSETSSTVSMAWEPTYAETAHNFFENGLATGWTVATGTWTVEPIPDPTRSVMVYGTSGSEAEISTFTSGPSGDYEGEALYDLTAAPTTGQVGVVGHYVDSSDYYKFVYDAPSGTFRLVKVVSGVTTVLQSVLPASVYLAFDPTRVRLFLKFEGSAISCTVNSTQIITLTDTTFTSGNFGLFTSNLAGYFDLVRVYTPNQSSYSVYRSTSPYSGFTALATGVASASYTDSSLVSGTTYYYHMTAVNGNGESYGISNTVMN